MRNIQSYADIKRADEDGDLTVAEEALIACSQSGQMCEFAYGPHLTPPTIGADLLRYLITGGCGDCVVHDKGVQLIGAYVPDRLDLDYANAKGTTNLSHCHFEQTVLARYCRFNTLSLEGSTLQQGLSAQGTVISGSIFLHNGFSAKGCVDVNSAIIGGQLVCTGAQIEVTEGHALNAQNAQIKSDVFLSNGFSSRGNVDLCSAIIGGQLACTGAEFHVGKGKALNLQETQAAQFFWRGVTKFSGRLDLSGAHFGTLVDAPESWDMVKDLILIGLSYDHISNLGNTENRLKWLGNGDTGDGEFSPQPYTQLAKVLRDMGHDRDARLVLYEKEKRLAQAEKQRSQQRAIELQGAQSAPEFHCLPQHVQQSQNRALTGLREEQLFSTIWNALLRNLVGFGYKPRLILYWTLGIILAMTMLSSLTYNLGGMVPNSPVVLLSDEWGEAVEKFNPAEAWVATKAGQHYETFSAVAYAADVFIPLVPLGQEAAWAPTTQTTFGWLL